MPFVAILLWSTLAGIFIAATAVLILLPSRYEQPSTIAHDKSVSVQILVLGDIGRSPRMQYHALSIAKHGGNVHLIGYHESRPHPDLLASPRITIHPLPAPPKILRSTSIPFVVAGPLKVLWQVATLVRVLAYTTPASTWLLVQNPPSIPTLVIAFVISVLRNTRLMIDWHNYGWTILAGTKGRNHPFVEISKAYECALGQAAPTANITVTHAMAKELQNPPYDIKSPIVTLHDRPAAIFQPLESASERDAFLTRLPETKDFAASILTGETRLIVSSTSWTPDEDFSLLLDALVSYAETDRAQAPIIAIITGKGPQKSYYEQQVQELQKRGRLPNIRVFTAWLSVEEYASLLRCADLGVCLHKSSSGVDLPMKVVDMFGSGLPVAAYSAYSSFGELVKEGVNGCGFETADELAAILTRLFSTKGADELDILRRGARKESDLRWDEEWDRVLGRIFGLTDHQGSRSSLSPSQGMLC
ncbi:glycosyltransferase family 33 protein [Xylaria sp. CBS 124048]|nr:glycosyltransferase family 33 protein [Xylaria sp. CBS 124048]